MSKLKFGLFGWPVKHSVSPMMQEAGFRAVGLDGSYELFETPPEKLAGKVAELRTAGYRGWNITVPHKTAMLELVDEVDPTARLVGSVNTVLNDNGRLRAWSTDGYGLEMSVRRSFGLELSGKNVLFWGCGGAARATAAWFAVRGTSALTLVNRTRDKALSLGEVVRQLAPDCHLTILEPHQEAELQHAFRKAAVVIQSTSVGLHAEDPCSIPEELLTPGLRIIDMIYRPTKLLETALARGCLTANGRDMLLYQGVRSFELWTGICPGPEEAMGQALDEALRLKR